MNATVTKLLHALRQKEKSVRIESYLERGRCFARLRYADLKMLYVQSAKSVLVHGVPDSAKCFTTSMQNSQCENNHSLVVLVQAITKS
jgi:hypothetical protein